MATEQTTTLPRSARDLIYLSRLKRRLKIRHALRKHRDLASNIIYHLRQSNKHLFHSTTSTLLGSLIIVLVHCRRCEKYRIPSPHRHLHHCACALNVIPQESQHNHVIINSSNCCLDFLGRRPNTRRRIAISENSTLLARRLIFVQIGAPVMWNFDRAVILDTQGWSFGPHRTVWSGRELVTV